MDRGGLFGDSDDSSREKSLSSKRSGSARGGGRPNQFASGDELKKLRADVENLKENLAWAESVDDEDRIFDLKKAIANGEKRDPDLAYANALRLIAQTKASAQLSEENKQFLMEKWQEQAQAARSFLPRFQLEGLWVGNYGFNPSGTKGSAAGALQQELVNVTYAGDTLIATKVTGDDDTDNVPRGQVSFTADLAPPMNASDGLSPLRITLQSGSSSSPNTALPRYSGKGQIAKPGYRNHQFVEGQLVMFDTHFSFVWIPTRHHVLFRRPSVQQTMDLLRDVISREDELENKRFHLSRCFDMDVTDSVATAMATDDEDCWLDDIDGLGGVLPTQPFRRIALQQDLKLMEEAMENRGSRRFKFWHVHKWFDGGKRSNRDGHND